MNFLKDIFTIFYPDICLCCKDQLTTNEELVCISCRHDLPTTNFTNQPDNIVEKIFYGRVAIVEATSLFYFLKKGKVQELIHQLKYKNQQKVGTFIGDWLGEIILESERFKTIDCIIPVPLHKKKQQLRGYNQVSNFGKSLSQKLNIPFYEDILLKKSATKTQTKKLRLERWKNSKHQFTIQNNTTFNCKHILLIDDIITTGATLEACINAFKDYKNIKISIATMAYTQ
ncbi:ComF family protein [Lutibacter sp. A80]|uniref:ComF family protein n=1 Tax=Lutibacter sp. A80 TaxID=2918453 RepID=UPI001F060503|nr:phosphoribosyltransferase family protein [Lutibacter sp. A80]UMB59735.1 ComF family protein [Lutibacter sp. A80]